MSSVQIYEDFLLLFPMLSLRLADEVLCQDLICLNDEGEESNVMIYKTGKRNN